VIEIHSVKSENLGKFFNFIKIDQEDALNINELDLFRIKKRNNEERKDGSNVKL